MARACLASLPAYGRMGSRSPGMADRPAGGARSAHRPFVGALPSAELQGHDPHYDLARRAELHDRDDDAEWPRRELRSPEEREGVEALTLPCGPDPDYAGGGAPGKRPLRPARAASSANDRTTASTWGLPGAPAGA